MTGDDFTEMLFGAVALLVLVAFITVAIIMVVDSERAELRDRVEHLEQCSDLAETVEAFRHCAGLGGGS